jgi:hypothetical protein
MTRFVDATPLERLLAVALLLVLALCSGGAWAEGSAGEQLPYRPSSIAWAPCPEFSSLACGVLQLPMDYRQPGGQTFGTAVIRARATHRQVDRVVSGGPAAAARGHDLPGHAGDVCSARGECFGPSGRQGRLGGATVT